MRPQYNGYPPEDSRTQYASGSNGYNAGPSQYQQQGVLQDEANDIEFMCDDGKPLQLVKFDKKSGKFTVEAEAAALLNEVKGNVGFCALAGKYRTGKSFLLNQLLCLKGQGVDSGFSSQV